MKNQRKATKRKTLAFLVGYLITAFVLSVLAAIALYINQNAIVLLPDSMFNYIAIATNGAAAVFYTLLALLIADSMLCMMALKDKWPETNCWDLTFWQMVKLGAGFPIYILN